MIIALNNKSNLTKYGFIEYQDKLSDISSKHKLILCASPINIGEFKLTNYSLGSQNVSKYQAGAHTGEIAATQLKSYNVEYCIVGHSERRSEQKETSQEINEKIINLLQENIIPILCVGETKEEYQENIAKEVVRKDLLEATKSLEKEDISKIIIAYEPIFSIGTGIVPTNEYICQMLTAIKNIFPQNKVLYGGSVSERNIEELKKCQGIDGYLLGGLSLNPNLLKTFLEKLEN